MKLRESLKIHADMMRQAKNIPEGALVASSVFDFVHRLGRDYASAPLTKEEYAYLCFAVDVSGMKFPIRQCYRNAQVLLMKGDFDRRFIYVEGYASRESLVGFPILHGWLEINGKVIDLTMRHPRARAGRFRDRVIGEWKDGREYIGVRFNRSYVYGGLTRGYAGSLLDDAERDHGILRGRTSREEWAFERPMSSVEREMLEETGFLPLRRA